MDSPSSVRFHSVFNRPLENACAVRQAALESGFEVAMIETRSSFVLQRMRIVLSQDKCWVVSDKWREGSMDVKEQTAHGFLPW